MIASMDRELTGIIWEDSLLYIFHMGAVHANCHIVLAFASYSTSMTTYA
jgi:hypothetical protein